MPPLVIAAAIAAGGSVAGAALSSRAAGKASREQSNASLEAARIQDAATQRAEVEQRRIHDELREQNAPYLQAGQQSVSRMGGLLSQGRDWRATGTTPTFQVPARPRGPNRLAPLMAEEGSGRTPAATAQAPMVMMRSPAGHRKEVPAAQVGYYTQRGAQVVR